MGYCLSNIKISLVFNLVVSQVSVVFPLLIQVGRYFEKQIKSRRSYANRYKYLVNLHSNLSFFRNSYDGFAGYKATLDRLTGFSYAIDMANRQSTSHLHEHETDVIFKDLSISNPFGKP